MSMFPIRRMMAPLRALVAGALVTLGAVLASLPAEAQTAFEPTRFSVEVRGEGPDVILIPGLSTSREVWRPHLPTLEGHRVHMVQVRGFGEEAGVNAEGPIMDGLIAELAQYIETEEIVRPAIVGHSMGGFIAMSLATRHPGLPGRIMIVDSLPWFAAIMVPPGTEPDPARTAQQAQMARAMMASQYGRNLPEDLNDPVLLGYTIDPANLQTLRNLTADADPRVTGQLVYELLLGDMREAIAAIGVPVIVIVPHRPGLMNRDDLEAFYRSQFAALPSAEFKVISPAAHFVMVDQPEAFDAALREFLAD